jgi:hypothetical protein
MESDTTAAPSRRATQSPPVGSSYGAGSAARSAALDAASWAVEWALTCASINARASASAGRFVAGTISISGPPTWLEEKLSQYHNKIKSIADDFVNLAAAGGFGRLGSRHCGVRILDMTSNRIVLAGVQPDADTVNATIYLNTFNPLWRKRAFTFGASQRVLALPRRGSRHTGCGWQSRRVQRRRQQSLAREPDSGAMHAMRERGRANCLQFESATISRTAKHHVI